MDTIVAAYVVNLKGGMTVRLRINSRTATIDPGDGTHWRVGFALLRHVVDV